LTLPHNSRCAESISRRTRRRVCSDKLPSASAIPACGVCSGSVTGPMLPGQPIPAIQPVPARPSAQKCTARALCSAPRVRTADIGRASRPHADHGGAPRAQQLGAGPSDAATGAGDNNDRTTPIHGTRVATRLCCSGLQPHNGETASVRAMRHPAQILLVTADMGGGHNATARALQEQATALLPQAEIRWVDTLDAMGPAWARCSAHRCRRHPADAVALRVLRQLARALALVCCGI